MPWRARASSISPKSATACSSSPTSIEPHLPAHMTLAGGLLLMIASAASAQWPGDQKIPPVRYPTLPRHATALTGFVPTGWRLQDKAVGDLNGDGLPDAALVLWMHDPNNRIHPSYDPKQRYDTNPLMLVVALGSRSGGYDLVAAN